MCKSVKGAAFFGSSIHVVAAFVFLFWFLFDTVISEMGINLWKCIPPDDDPPRKYNLLVHYLNMLFKFLYYITLCVTGIYIFRGVERASPKMIKFALLVFVIMQVVGLALFIGVSFTYWEETIVEEKLAGITSSSLVGLEQDFHGTGNDSDIVEDEDSIIPVLESPLTTTTTTSIQPDPPEIVYVKVPVKIPFDDPNKSKLSHNQLVTVVFQILLVVINAVASTIYSIVMTFYLVTL